MPFDRLLRTCSVNRWSRPSLNLQALGAALGPNAPQWPVSTSDLSRGHYRFCQCRPQGLLKNFQRQTPLRLSAGLRMVFSATLLWMSFGRECVSKMRALRMLSAREPAGDLREAPAGHDPAASMRLLIYSSKLTRSGRPSCCVSA